MKTSPDGAVSRSSASRGPVDPGASTGPRPNVLGLDLSLTSTGLAMGHHVDTIKPGDRRGVARLKYIRGLVLDHVALGKADLVVVEGPSYDSKGRGVHERGGLWWIIAYLLEEIGTPYAVVPPGSLKLYATGNGRASKDAVLAAWVRRFPEVPITSNDEADAHVLAAMGLDYLGHPLAEVPARQRAALAKVAWPTAVAR